MRCRASLLLVVIFIVFAGLPAISVHANDLKGAIRSRKSFSHRPESPDHFPLVFHDPDETSQNKVKKLLEAAPVFAELTKALSKEIDMPTQVTVEFGSCGQANSFYTSDNKMVAMCYELADDFLATFKRVSEKGTSKAEINKAMIGAMSFIFLHELGHALIDVLELPVVGREEDAADQLATLLLIELGDEGIESVFSAVWEFATLAEDVTDVSELDFGDVHSLDAQRAYNMMCLIYGSSPGDYESLIEEEWLTKERAETCEDEYKQLKKAWDSLLAPHERGGGVERTSLESGESESEDEDVASSEENAANVEEDTETKYVGKRVGKTVSRGAIR